MLTGTLLAEVLTAKDRGDAGEPGLDQAARGILNVVLKAFCKAKRCLIWQFGIRYAKISSRALYVSNHLIVIIVILVV